MGEKIPTPENHETKLRGDMAGSLAYEEGQKQEDGMGAAFSLHEAELPMRNLGEVNTLKPVKTPPSPPIK